MGDDVAVPAFGLCKFVGCVCSLSWLMLSISVLPCVSVILSSSSFVHQISLFIGFYIITVFKGRENRKIYV
jgi:hypothetical protein